MPARLTSSLAAGAAALALLFSACGGDDGRPSADELKDAFLENDTSGTFDEEVAQCFADTLHGSDISDSGLRTLLDSPDIEDIGELDLSEDDQAAAQAAGEQAVSECLEIPDIEVPETPDASTSEGG